MDGNGRPTQDLLLVILFLALGTVYPFLLGLFLVGMAYELLMPLGYIYLVLRGNRQTAWLALVAPVIALGGMVGAEPALWYGFRIGMTGLLLGFAIQRRLTPVKSIAVALVPAVGLVLWLTLTPHPARDTLVTEINRQGTELMNMLQGAEVGEEERAYLQRTIDLIIELLPALQILAALFNTLITYLLAGYLLPRVGFSVAKLTPFAVWQVWDHLVWVFAAGLLLYLVGYPPFKPMASNLLCLTFVVYLVQGVAIARYYFRASRLPRLAEVIFYLVGLVLAQQSFALLLAGLGLFDTWFDFRRLQQPKPSS